MSDITEFTFLDTEEMHLVGRSANGFAEAILIKATEDLQAELDEVIKDFVEGLCGVSGCEVCHERYLAVKGSDTNMEKAKLKSKDRKALSDGDFAYIDSKGDKHLPINDASHVRNALARFNQTHFESSEAKSKAHAKIVARAKEMGVEVSEETAEKETADISPSLVQTHEVADDVSAGGTPEAGDGGEPTHQEVASEKPAESDGAGDQDPSKDTPKGEALGQTDDNVEGAAKNAPMADDGGNPDAVPGSPAWEHKDADLAEKVTEMSQEITRLSELLASREKAEKAEVDGAVPVEATTGADASTDTEIPTVSKETEMTEDELQKALADNTEQLMARLGEVISTTVHAEVQKAKKDKKAKAKAMADKTDDGEGADGGAAKAEDAAPEVDAAAKAAELESTHDAELAKMREDLSTMAGIVEKMSSQEVGHPFLNAAGLTAQPFARVVEGAVDPDEAFKGFDDAIADALERTKAGDPQARVQVDHLRMQKAQAKLIANERARQINPNLGRDPRFPDGTAIFTNRRALPDDPSVQGWGGGRGQRLVS